MCVILESHAIQILTHAGWTGKPVRIAHPRTGFKLISTECKEDVLLSHYLAFVEFQVLMAASMKMTSFISLMMEVICTYETLVYFETTGHYIPQGCHFYIAFSYTLTLTHTHITYSFHNCLV
jgi:hypothetical protein